MEKKDPTNTLPEQKEGREIMIEKSVTVPEESAAEALYERARSRLLLINAWHELAGTISAEFRLSDSTGEALYRLAQQGEFVRIDIPGPGSDAGGGYDWVKIEALTEMNGAVDAIAMRVRPSHDPAGSTAHVAHFYDASSTSTFIIERQGPVVYARIIDRNTKPNEDTISITDKLRHTVVGNAAIGAFSKLQWEALAKAFLA